MKNSTNQNKNNYLLNGKARFLFSLILFFTLSIGAKAQVVITPATGGTNISADKAANSSGHAWTTLGTIKIAETLANDFAPNQSGVTFVLTAPSNWVFNTSAGSVGYSSNGSFSSVSITSITSNAVTVTFSTTNTSAIDYITISGLQVEPSNGNLFQAVVI